MFIMDSLCEMKFTRVTLKQKQLFRINTLILDIFMLFCLKIICPFKIISSHITTL